MIPQTNRTQRSDYSQQSNRPRPSTLRSSSEAGPLYNLDELNSAFDTASEATFRNGEGVERLLRELTTPLAARSPSGFSSGQSSDQPGSSIDEYDLVHVDDSPELAPPESLPPLAVSPIAEIEAQSETLRITSTEYGRAVIVKCRSTFPSQILNKLRHYLIKKHGSS